jgi:hypothetical protein
MTFTVEQPADSHTETVAVLGTGARVGASVLRTPGMAPCVRLVARDVTSTSLHLSRDQARHARDELSRVLLALELEDAQVA